MKKKRFRAAAAQTLARLGDIEHNIGLATQLVNDALRQGAEIFHAGTKADGSRIVANGGRVLNVCARGKTVREAQSRAYAAVDLIRWPDGFCRRDIGWRAIERE